MIGAKPHTRYEAAAEYLQFDWEFAATPEETSWIASSWVKISSVFPCFTWRDLTRRPSRRGSH